MRLSSRVAGTRRGRGRGSSSNASRGTVAITNPQDVAGDGHPEQMRTRERDPPGTGIASIGLIHCVTAEHAPQNLQGLWRRDSRPQERTEDGT
ncbi:hypothetical protein GCM10025876_08050 [Demequina litorisediminis]|uniref:Uncharacterized protein n=1 Tax=Demequina litorisediminis TaxID=1849022 RepID=A0ABQ6IA68_9MICO|nr:hypothetical protein GCM10025876_08050 [Demequina litorisediminis]